MTVDKDAPAPELAEEAIALDFAAEHHRSLRYIDAWRQWRIWDGRVWVADDTLDAFNHVRRACRLASHACKKEGQARTIASAKTAAAVERLSKADRRLAATVDQWDRDAWLLNTPGGVVELRTGKLRPHRPDDFMTKITSVAPEGECPLWLALVRWISGGDSAYAAYLQRVAGYVLTGSTAEHALFFLHGDGGNGKGTFINTMAGILRDYAKVAPMETFTESQGERHPTDLAMLRGARLVTAQETESDRHWAEARIKSITGGDPITARFMRQDFFTYQPQFKLMIAGNHQPALRHVDQAIRRRFHLLPFGATVKGNAVDINLPAKLQDEWPGILQWMVQGCLEYQRGGLAAPAVVLKATNEYLEAEDAVGVWLSDCCVVAPDAYSTMAELYASWTKHQHDGSERPGTQKRFSQRMRARGFLPKRKGGTGAAGFEGVALKPFGLFAAKGQA
jgi:putative DNA primase/helicase